MGLNTPSDFGTGGSTEEERAGFVGVCVVCVDIFCLCGCNLRGLGDGSRGHLTPSPRSRPGCARTPGVNKK